MYSLLQIIQPSLEEIQNTLNQAVQYVTEIGQHIPQWTPPTPLSTQSTPRSNISQPSQGMYVDTMYICYLCGLNFDAPPPPPPVQLLQTQPHGSGGSSNYYRAVHDSKDVLKLASMLSSAVLAGRQDLMRVSSIGYGLHSIVHCLHL